MVVVYVPELVRPGKPFRELKWEIPLWTSPVSEKLPAIPLPRVRGEVQGLSPEQRPKNVIVF